MSPSLHPVRVGLFALLAVAAAAGCQSCCAQDPLVHDRPPACTLDTCGNGDDFRFGKCVASGCLNDNDCCPGTRCRTDVNSCSPVLLDPEYACEQNSDCKDPAQRCIDTKIGDRDPIPTCVYQLCNGDSDCGFGRVCYDGRCIDQAPCGGSCPSGTACDVVTSVCAPFPKGSVGCDKTCGAGQLKVFTDPNTMSGEACCGLSCECDPLPPIVPSRFGRYSRVVVANGKVQVSAYDAQFGDLVLVQFGLDGNFAGMQYIDGIPGGSPVVAATDVRGGIADPGPNVGTHTSIAADAQGLVRIAYRDEDAKTVKVAIQQPDFTFKTYLLDGANDTTSDYGRFTDIAVAGDGTVFVTYLAHNTTLAGVSGTATGIKLAKSRNANPKSASDWDITVVDARPVFDPCNAACTAGQQCVLNGGAPQCLSTATGCNPACTGAKECVDTGGGALDCLAPPLPPESPDLPRARGLYTSVAVDGTTPIVAYYDAIDGDLRVVAGVGGTPVVLDGDGQNGHRNGDIGRYPSVAKLGNNLTIAYEDFGRHEVRAWQGAQSDLGTGGTYTLVDRGQIANVSGKLFVGAGARLAKNHAAPVLVYQDASNLDLKRADFDGTAWVPNTVLTDGAHGFYSDVAVSGGKAYIVSVQAQLDERGVEASRLGLTVQPAP